MIQKLISTWRGALRFRLSPANETIAQLFVVLPRAPNPLLPPATSYPSSPSKLAMGKKRAPTSFGTGQSTFDFCPHTIHKSCGRGRQRPMRSNLPTQPIYQYWSTDWPTERLTRIWVYTAECPIDTNKPTDWSVKQTDQRPNEIVRISRQHQSTHLSTYQQNRRTDKPITPTDGWT